MVSANLVSSYQATPKLSGQGLWIRDLQSSISPNDFQHNYTGTDIEASYFPKDNPKNTRYQVQDITKPWPADWTAKFDLVHQRLALVVPGNEESTLKVLRGYINLLKPGGWIQLVEVRQWTRETDGQAFKDLNVCLADMIQSIGSSLKHIDNAKGWLEDLGLVDVQEETAEANYGTREDKKIQEIAKRSILTTAGSILGITSSMRNDLI
jgi:SAM-dependent methyltransferase